MSFLNWFQSLKARASAQRHSRRHREEQAQIESLESRLVLYVASGNLWPNPSRITISFMPDGTNLGSSTSNLQSTFNAKFGSAATWQNQILKAAQFWAEQTNINFVVVPDNGGAAGSGSYQQGDPGFGDIRIGGFNFGNTTLAMAYAPPPVNNYSIAGDIQLNTGVNFNVGTTYDLFTVSVHEIGHALGLNHSTVSTACMYATYSSTKTALNADDISGIKAIYSGGAARANDSYDATSNGTTTAASVITSLINTTTKTAVINNLNLATTTDLDFFKFVVPTGSATTLKAKVVGDGNSLLNAKVEILNSTGTVKATATAAATDFDGTTVTASLAGIAAGQTYFVKVSSASTTTAFKTGKYSLVLNMGTGTDPAITTSSSLLSNGTTLTAGGGQAFLLQPETAMNTTLTGTQTTSDRSVAATPMDGYVAVWTSSTGDGSGTGIYGRRFDVNGVALGGEFLINTTTANDQTEPAVAVDGPGNFVVTWTSALQDGSGTGIYGQRFKSDGTRNGGEFRVNTTTTNNQSASSVASDTYGNFVVTWTSDLQDGSGLGVYGQRYNLLGAADGSEFCVNNYTTGNQSDSQVVKNRLMGDFIVTWSSVGQDGSGSGIYGQRYSASGSPTGSEFKINTTTANDQTDPQIGIDRLNGDFVVVWTSNLTDGSGLGVNGQRYNTAGVAKGAEFRVNTTTTGNQSDASVAVDGAGNIFVTWAGASTSNGLEIYGQQYDRLGTKIEGEIVIGATRAGDQSSPSVAMDFFGRTTVFWSGNGVTDAAGVFSARYRTDLHSYGEEHDHGLTEEDHDHDDLDHDHSLVRAASAWAEDRRDDEFVDSFDVTLAPRLDDLVDEGPTSPESGSDEIDLPALADAAHEVSDLARLEGLLNALEVLSGTSQAS